MKKVLLLFFLAGSQLFVTSLRAQGVMDHLEYFAHKITAGHAPPSSLTVWEQRRDTLWKQFLKIINLDPMPEKTPLNTRFVGGRVDLGDCYFQRVVFESRPGIYVAAHLYIPKNVSFPVPAVIHVPGHSRRDRYRPHPRTYAANGFIALGLPMVGEEGKRGAGWDACGEHGPYVGHFNWFNTGYSAAGPTVWDGIRAVDFLLTLKDDQGVRMVDSSRIGMAGLSGGSARTLWTTIADPRISCAVVNEGITAIEGYQVKGGIENTCDIHLFYNYYGLPYAALYSLIAPRPLLVQNGTEDPLYPNPRPVAAYLARIYELYGQTGHFEYKEWHQSHGYSEDIWKAEDAWMDQWLREGKSPLKICPEPFEAVLTCFPEGEPPDMRNTEQVFTLPTPVWKVGSREEYAAFRKEMMNKLQEEVMRTAYRKIPAVQEILSSEKGKGYNFEELSLKMDEGTICHKGYFFYVPGKRQRTVILVSSPSGGKDELKQLYEEEYLPRGLNLYCTEVTGTGDNPWVYERGYVYDRFAMLTGYTLASLRVDDILAAVRTIAKRECVDAEGLFVRGKGSLSVPVLYAAVADSSIAGVILEDAPDRHTGITPVKTTECNTAMFNILKYGDIPQVAALIYPRKLILAGEHKTGFEWTRDIYSLLGRQRMFIETGTAPGDVLKALAGTHVR